MNRFSKIISKGWLTLGNQLDFKIRRELRSPVCNNPRQEGFSDYNVRGLNVQPFQVFCSAYTSVMCILEFRKIFSMP